MGKNGKEQEEQEQKEPCLKEKMHWINQIILKALAEDVSGMGDYQGGSAFIASKDYSYEQASILIDFLISMVIMVTELDMAIHMDAKPPSDLIIETTLNRMKNIYKKHKNEIGAIVTQKKIDVDSLDGLKEEHKKEILEHLKRMEDEKNNSKRRNSPRHRNR